MYFHHMYEYGAQLSPVKKNSQVRVCGENLWGDIWAGAVSRCGCGVRCAGAGAVHVRVNFCPHTGVWAIRRIEAICASKT